jgi:hypothetical protein
MAEINTSPWMWIFIVSFVICIFVGFFTLILGFGFSLLGKDVIGSRFIKFGAGCSAVAFLSVLVAKADVFIGILVIYWILWLKFRKGRTNLCPSCGAKIATEQKLKFSNLFGFRRSISCLSCGDNMILSKWPWRIMGIGSLLFLGLLLLKLFKVDFGYMQNFIFYVPLLLLLIGHFFLKLEDMTSKA